MPITTQNQEPLTAPSLPGRLVLKGAQQLLINCLVIGIGYSVFTTASRGAPAGPTGPDQPAYEVSLTLHPSPLVYVVVAVVFYAVHRVLTRTTDEASAIRVFRRASLVVLVIAASCVLVADVWFFTSPLAGWPRPGTWIAPFPFGTQDVTTKMLTGS